MDKTRNAFALRKLYDVLFSVVGEEIVPTYDERQSVNALQSSEYLNSIAGQFEYSVLDYLSRNQKEILESIEASKSAFNLAEKKLEQCRDRQKVLNADCERIAVHVKKLQADERRIFEKVLSQGLSDDLKEKGNRIKELIRKYDWLNRLLFDYGLRLMKDEKVLESDFQVECRKAFGRRLRQARLERKYSMEFVAGKIGITKSGYGYYELGIRDLPTPTIYKLAKILGVSLDWLFCLK